MMSSIGKVFGIINLLKCLIKWSKTCVFMQQFLWSFFQWLSQNHQNSHYSPFPSIPSHLAVCTVQCCLSTLQRCLSTPQRCSALSTPQRTWRGRRSDVTGRRPSLRCDTEVLTLAESLRQFPSPFGRRRSSAPSGVSVTARSPRRCSPTLIIVDSYLTSVSAEVKS